MSQGLYEASPPQISASGSRRCRAPCCISHGSAQAQSYPVKPVRIITHSAPGGSPDALLRIVADRLSQMWGRQIVVLNHPGAGGAVAARTAAQATPDGYTLYMPASSAFVTLSGLQASPNSWRLSRRSRRHGSPCWKRSRASPRDAGTESVFSIFLRTR
jgi:hypothetical protein